MAEVASAYVSLIPSAQNFGRNTERAIGGQMTRAGEAGGRAYGTGMLSAAKRFAGPLTAVFAGAKVIDFFKDSITEASDLNEAGTALSQTFGDAVGKVNKFAKGGAEALGQSRLDVLNAAQSFGVYGKAAGLAADENAKFSTKLVSLSTDLASFYNTSPEEAVQAIAAGLRGESEPLRRYGVLLNDATLRQEAMRLGLIKTTKEALTPQQKVLAANAAIMEQTSDAQGDFERTSSGLANQQRILAAQFEDMKGTIGKALLPVVLDLVKEVNGEVVPAVKDFIAGMQDGTGAGGKFADILLDAKDALGDVLAVIKSIPAPVLLMVAKLGLGYIAYSKLSGVVGNATTALSGFTSRVTDSQARMDLMRGAATRLAGTGGLLLLARSSTTASNNMSILEGAASGALLGFAAGGPLGAAVGAGIGFLTRLAGTSRDVASAQDAIKRSVSEVVDTLNQETGAITKNTVAAARKALADSGVYDAAQRMNVNLRDLTKAYLGNEAATRRVGEQMKANYTARMREGGDAVNGLSNDIKILNGAITQQTSAMDAARRHILQMNEAARTYGSILDGLNGKTVKTFIETIYTTNSTGEGGDPRFSGRRASGGPVDRGGAYLVGENGPELFVPRNSGSIIPHANPAAVGGSASGGSKRVQLVVGGKAFDAYMREVADDTYSGQRAFRSTTHRMRGHR